MTYRTRRQLPLDVMVLLPLLVLIVFSYVPMAGIVIAFQKFIPAKGLFGDQKWIGLDNFIYIANLPHAARAFRNSLIIASLKIVFGLIVPIVVSHVWKEFGFGTIIYLAAITTIDPGFYEAAVMDGARRLRQMWHITIPGMAMVIILIAALSLGSVLNAGFEQILNLYNPLVYETGDIIDTLVYRTGIIEAQYGPATAVGLFQSAVALILISTSYYLAYRFANYRIF